MSIDTSVPNWRWPVRILCGLYLVAIFSLTHMPVTPNAAAAVANWDKLIHFSLYFGLSGLIALSNYRRTVPHVPVMAILLAVAGWAGVDETTQAFVGRTPAVGDWLADCTGIIAGLFVGMVLSPYVPGVERRIQSWLSPKHAHTTRATRN